MRLMRGSRAVSLISSHWPELLLLSCAAMLMPVVQWAWTTAHGSFNDFHDYYLAGRLVLNGQSPYDIQALRELARSENLNFLVGSGYSYPLPFAIFMVPFALLPFDVSVAVFVGLSIALFGLTVALWIGWAFGWRPELARRRFVLALAAGSYPPVFGTVANGQVNLMLFPLMAGGILLAVSEAGRGRRIMGGLLLGLATIVKLVPGVVIAPYILGRRWAGAGGTIVGALGTLIAAVLVAPWAAANSGGLAALFEPDSYFTNQSINGFVTRLVNVSERTQPLFLHAFDPRLPMLAATAALGLATVALLWRARARLATRRGMAMGVALALVAGVIGAPKSMFWSQAFALISAGLVLAEDVPDLRLGRLGRTDLTLLGVWLGGSAIWAFLWLSPLARTTSMPALMTLLQSSGLYGMLALWLLTARRLAMPVPETAARTEVSSAAEIADPAF